MRDPIPAAFPVLSLILVVMGCLAPGDCRANEPANGRNESDRAPSVAMTFAGASCLLDEGGISFCLLEPRASGKPNGLDDPFAFECVTVDQAKNLPPRQGLVLRLAFLGTNPRARLRGLESKSGTRNVYRGRNPKSWIKSQALYKSVIYESLWPGVDLLIHESASSLRYELRADDPAALDQVRYRWEGSTEPSAEKGDYETVNTPFGALTILPRLGAASIPTHTVPVLSCFMAGLPSGVRSGLYRD